jgi:hypothetical protein
LNFFSSRAPADTFLTRIDPEGGYAERYLRTPVVLLKSGEDRTPVELFITTAAAIRKIQA